MLSGQAFNAFLKTLEELQNMQFLFLQPLKNIRLSQLSCHGVKFMILKNKNN